MKQLMTSSDCKNCLMCCTFEKCNYSPSPILSTDEKNVIVLSGISPSHFKKSGKKLWEIKLKSGKKCPFYSGWKCTIYKNRPLDCKLWPYWPIWDEKKKKIMLGVEIDVKCPASLRPKSRDYEVYMRKYLQSKKMVEIFSDCQELVYEDSEKIFRLICELPKLTVGVKK